MNNIFIYIFIYFLIKYYAFLTVAPCILILSKYFIYQEMHNRVALKEY
jgi:hypothetical protein